MAFATAVERKTHQYIKMHKRSVFGNTGLYDFGLGDYEADDADDEIKALELRPDQGPSPETIARDKQLAQRALDAGQSFVKKPKHLKALLLWCDGMTVNEVAAYFQIEKY